MCQGRRPADDRAVDEPRRVVLRLEVTIGDQMPISGVVRTQDGRVQAFSGWSEMFAALQVLTAEPGGDAEQETGA
jgi:hypothetical protein